MFLSSILGFLAGNADRFLLAGFVDSATLGIYSIAFTIVSSIAQILTRIFSDVSLPALSEVTRERPFDLKLSLYRFHIATASFTYICAGLLIVSGNTLIGLLYDRRYEQAGWMLDVLAVGLLSVPFNLAQLQSAGTRFTEAFHQRYSNSRGRHDPAYSTGISLFWRSGRSVGDCGESAFERASYHLLSAQT